jgi:trigger factor
MKVEKKEAAPCVMELIVNADAEEIKADYKEVFGVFLRNGVIPGFRKGKAPADMIRHKFQSEITQEAIQKCFRKFYPEALKESGLEVVNLQGLSSAKIAPETGFEFTAIVEVAPKFSLPKYKKLSIKREEVKITDEQVAERVEEYRKAYAKYEEAKEGATVADGDFVNFDYKGTLDGTPLIEIVPDMKNMCEYQGFWTQVEEGRFLSEVLEALKGMKAGETKTGVKVKFPDDAAPEAIKGKTCEYEIALKSFRCRVLPDDKALAEAAKAESIDELQKRIRIEMETEATDAELANRRNQAVELLLKKADFDVPPCLVQQQTEIQLDSIARRAQYSGLPADYFEKNRDAILADAENAAVRQVRLSYILRGIAEEENVEVTDDDMAKAFERIAESSSKPTTADEVRKQFEANGRIEGYKDHLRADKALDLVLAEAK